MSNSEHDAIFALIGGIQGQLDAIKELLKPKADETICRHNDMTTIETMGGVQGAFCSDCGAEFVMGVLDKDENNE